MLKRIPNFGTLKIEEIFMLYHYSGFCTPIEDQITVGYQNMIMKCAEIDAHLSQHTRVRQNCLISRHVKFYIFPPIIVLVVTFQIYF